MSAGPPPEGTPTVSVVVIAHRRTEYLPGAIRSVLAQELARDRYEVLVVANALPEEPLDDFRAAGVRFLESRAEELGAKVAEGLAATRGEVVALLEDDDRFAPGRLNAVVDRFVADPSLVYYHGAFRTIGPDERPFPGPFHRDPAAARIARRHRIYRPAGAPPGGWSEFRGTFPGFNNSCLAVRRSAFLPHAARIARFDLATDEGLFLTAAASGGAILQDDAVGTLVMVHPASVSNPQSAVDGLDLERLREFSDRTTRALAALREVGVAAGRPDVVQLAEADAALQRLIGRLRRGEHDRVGYARAAGEMVRRPGALATQNYPMVPVLGLLGALAPGLASRTYRALRFGVAG